MAIAATAFHIAAGTISLAAGAGALAWRKGGGDHARWGTWFFGAMLAMAGSGAIIAALNGDPVTSIIGVATCYLVGTSWLAARPRGGRTAVDLAMFAIGLACAIGEYVCGWIASHSPGGKIGIYGPEVPYVFGTLLMLAALLDLNALARRPLAQPQRLVRHLWRMCVAFFLAAGSLFLGQQDDVFFFMAGSPLLFIPPFAVLGTMFYWIFRMRFGRGLARRKAARGGGPAQASGVN